MGCLKCGSPMSHEVTARVRRWPSNMQFPATTTGVTKMTAAAVETLFVPIDLLAFFVPLLRFHRERGDRARLQPFQRDRLPGLLAIAVGVVLDTLQRRVDLGDQFALPVAGAQLDRAVGFGGCAIG